MNATTRTAALGAATALALAAAPPAATADATKTSGHRHGMVSPGFTTRPSMSPRNTRTARVRRPRLTPPQGASAPREKSYLIPCS